MKAASSKTLVTFAGVGLVVPFVAVAVLVGARAVAGAESAEQNLLLAVMAICGALFGVFGGYARERGRQEFKALHITARERSGRRAFM